MNTTINSNIFNLKASDVLAVHLKSFQDWVTKSVPPEKALVRVLENLQDEIDEQRGSTQEAWGEMAKFKHPRTGAGILADKQAKLQRAITEGEKDGAEMKSLKGREATSGLQRGDKARMIALLNELASDAKAVTSIQESLKVDEENYARWSERYTKRQARLDQLRAEHNQLSTEGPSWLAQIRDAEKAKAAADEDARQGQGSLGQAEGILGKLQAQAETASLLEESAQYIDGGDEPDIDEQIRAREAEAASSDLIRSWIK